MSPSQTSGQVQGLHVLAVLRAAREVAAATARAGGAERVKVEAVREELAELTAACDRLSNYERQAVARGDLSVDTSSQDVADILERATGVLQANRESLDVLQQTAAEGEAAFDLEEEPVPATVPTGAEPTGDSFDL
jgi:exonuclease III